MPFIFALAFSLCSLARRHPVGPRSFTTSGSSSPALVFHAGWIEYLGFEARVSHREHDFEHFIGLPGSKRSRSQCVVMKEQFQFKWLSPRLARPSRVAQLVVTPPPNHSFKRTCLRQAA